MSDISDEVFLVKHSGIENPPQVSSLRGKPHKVSHRDIALLTRDRLDQALLLPYAISDARAVTTCIPFGAGGVESTGRNVS
jgi:hypothetical protein